MINGVVWPQPEGIWRHPEFRKVWAAQTVSLLGSQVTLLALPLTGVILGASNAEIGLLAAAGFAPDLVVALVAGAWVDRVRRRPLLIWTNLGRAALVATIPLAFALDRLSMTLLYVVAFLAGALSVVFGVAYGSHFPTLVPRELLLEANSRLELSRSAADVAGYGLAGGLIQILTAPIAIAVDTCSFLISAIALAMIRSPESDPPSGWRANIWIEIEEGLRFVLVHPLLRPLVTGAGAFNFFGAIVGALYVAYATKDLGLHPGSLGLALSLGAPGALLGAAAADRITTLLGVGRTIGCALLLCGGASILIPAAVVAPVPVLVVHEFLFGFGSSIFDITVISVSQAAAPPWLLGRTWASQRFVWGGAMPLGALVGGAVGELIGLRLTFVVAAGGMLLAALWLAATLVTRDRDWALVLE